MSDSQDKKLSQSVEVSSSGRDYVAKRVPNEEYPFFHYEIEENFIDASTDRKVSFIGKGTSPELALIDLALIVDYGIREKGYNVPEIDLPDFLVKAIEMTYSEDVKQNTIQNQAPRLEF